jgi:hypothetical protein
MKVGGIAMKKHYLKEGVTIIAANTMGAATTGGGAMAHHLSVDNNSFTDGSVINSLNKSVGIYITWKVKKSINGTLSQ